MKNIVITLLVIFLIDFTYSQKIILHRNSGGDQTYQLSSVDSITFLPFTCGDEIRYEGKTYLTVLIGTQCWMKENLNVGTMILGANDQTNNSIIEKYCYNNDTANCTMHGGLYQWNEAMQYVTTPGARGLCPEGWRIPTENELQTLKTTAGNSSNALKAIGQGSGAGTGTNTTGFTALLAGQRYPFGGDFYFIGSAGYFWSSTQSGSAAYRIDIYSNDNQVYFIADYKTYGFGIRCLKN
jgi:uncharacterized protein (TIGR02145 family)